MGGCFLALTPVSKAFYSAFYYNTQGLKPQPLAAKAHVQNMVPVLVILCNCRTLRAKTTKGQRRQACPVLAFCRYL